MRTHSTRSADSTPSTPVDGRHISLRCSGFVLPVVIAACLGLAGCGKSMSGKYEDSDHYFSIEFKSGKAYVTNEIAGVTTEADYKVADGKISLSNSAGNVILTENADGSLSGLPMVGDLKKVQSTQ